MKIPPAFIDILQRHDSLYSQVLSMLSNIDPWFEDNKLVFFPEYTDHGLKHIQQVTETAEALISADSWPILTPDDAAVLIMSIVLHDCAMHLSEDGFITLVTGEHTINEALGDKPWPELWNDFVGEALRFDDRKLKTLFDDTEPVRVPPLDPLEMTKKDRLLIGEFLRRHHPRLAHEIALSGVPGPQGHRLSLGRIPNHINELSGIVARSHGLDLRRSVDYLNGKSKWAARRTRGVHMTYLMTIVRIADYLQIQSGRAPHELLQVRSLRSPVSRGEWSAHRAVKDIHQETDDPEAIWIETQPEDVHTYLKLRHLVSDIQRELDDCWAVLGEVYASKEELRRLGLTIRRIKSNLDDEDAFAKTVRFVPYRASLEASGAELLKLLIRPLYGDRPEFGIRELLQNAVDACRELEDYLCQNPEMRSPESSTKNVSVSITLEKRGDGTNWLEVSDNGIGMSVVTIVNYYLKAGASFRNSEAWRLQHQDADGRSRVLRSGRFGIGVLAGFLLGSEIQVSTRHVRSKPDEGIEFSCRLDDETIELNRIQRSVGTTISIRLSNLVYSGLISTKDDWDWYCLEDPRVERLLLPEGMRLNQRYEIPSNNSPLPPTWRKMQYPGFDEIHWSYKKAPQLVCNGITISSGQKSESNWIFFRRPNISIFDSSGKLPLNLQRTALTVNELEFDADLLREVQRDFLAYLIVNTPTQPPSNSRAKESYENLGYPSLRPDPWYCCLQQGLTLLSGWHLRQLSISRIIYLLLEEAPHLKRMMKKNAEYCVVPVSAGSEHHDYTRGLSENTVGILFRYLRNDHQHRYIQRGFDDISIRGERIVGRRFEIEQFRDKEEPRERSYRDDDDDDYEYRHEERPKGVTFGGLKLEALTKTWCMLGSFDLEEDPDLVSPFNLPEKDLASFLALYIWQEDSTHKEQKSNHNSLVEAWIKIIQSPYIPYNLNLRKKILSNAYKELATYIESWLAVKNSDTVNDHASQLHR